jgi:hypothetical protein
LRQTDLTSVAGHLKSAQPLAVIGIALCAVSFAMAKAERWRYLLAPLAELRTSQLLPAVFMGSAVNYAVPHAGELVRAWVVSRDAGQRNAAVLTSIAIERLFDFLAVLVIGVAGLMLSPELKALGAHFWALGALLALLLTCVVPFVLWTEGALHLLALLLRPLPTRAADWLLGHARHGVAGLSGLLDPATLVRVIVASLLQWLLMVGCAWLSLRAVGLHESVALAQIIVLLLVVALTLPAAPGHIGTTQVAFVLASAPFGIDTGQAIAASLIYNAVVPASFIAPAAVYYMRRPLRAAKSGDANLVGEFPKRQRHG